MNQPLTEDEHRRNLLRVSAIIAMRLDDIRVAIISSEVGINTDGEIDEENRKEATKLLLKILNEL